jgi:predicted MPP superfamily phosphohydrolase
MFDKTRFIDRTRNIGGATMGTLGFCTSWAFEHKSDNPQWLEVVEIDMHLPNLTYGFHGVRIVHISDLHYSRTVSGKYLRRCVEYINFLEADIVVLTGDYVTHDIYGKFRQKVAGMLGSMRGRLGIYACLGNHDYGIGSVIGTRRDELMRQMTAALEFEGVNVLQNESIMVDIDGHGLWLVGLGDLWAQDFEPEKAFAAVPCDEAVIALLHNPDSIIHLTGFPAGLVMSGHTHGVRSQFSFSRRRPIKKRAFYAGLYDIGDKKLYVNRGLGRLGKAMFNPRPEITVFTLRCN